MLVRLAAVTLVFFFSNSVQPCSKVFESRYKEFGTKIEQYERLLERYGISTGVIRNSEWYLAHKTALLDLFGSQEMLVIINKGRDRIWVFIHGIGGWVNEWSRVQFASGICISNGSVSTGWWSADNGRRFQVYWSPPWEYRVAGNRIPDEYIHDYIFRPLKVQNH